MPRWILCRGILGRVSFFVAIVGFLMGSSGCASSPPVKLRAGESLYASKALRSVETVGLRRAARSVRQTRKALQLIEMNERIDGTSASYSLMNASNQTIWIKLEKRTPAETEIRIRYGVWGNEGKSQSVLEELRKRF